MLIPTITIHISGTVLAVYGAILSTITAAVQVVTHFRDRAHIKIRVQHSMEMIGDPRYAQKDLTMMYVVNAGRRPVTITGVGAYRLSPHKPIVIPTTIPVKCRRSFKPSEASKQRSPRSPQSLSRS